MTVTHYYCLLLLRDGRKQCLLYLRISAALTGIYTPPPPPPLKICLKRMFTFISGYFVHLFLHLKISYHLNHISGNHHPAQILSLEEVGGFFFRIMLPVSKKPEAWHISSSACLQFTQTTPRQQV